MCVPSQRCRHDLRCIIATYPSLFQARSARETYTRFVTAHIEVPKLSELQGYVIKSSAFALAATPPPKTYVVTFNQAEKRALKKPIEHLVTGKPRQSQPGVLTYSINPRKGANCIISPRNLQKRGRVPAYEDVRMSAGLAQVAEAALA